MENNDIFFGCKCGALISGKRRINACLNACEGIETGILEALPLNFKQHAIEFSRLQHENARLLDALKEITENLQETGGGFAVGEGNIKDAWNTARAAIAETEITETDQRMTTAKLDDLQNKAWRLREIENFLECEDLMDKFEEWYLDKQYELAAKHDPAL